MVDDRLEFDRHIMGVVNKANRMLGMIKIGFSCMDEEIFMNLYPVLVRPLLEYCVQVWSPNKQKYIELIEGVQKRAVRFIPGFRGLTYEQRLEKLKLTKLVDRRFRGDMIQTYKILTNKDDTNIETFFQMAGERGDPRLNRGLKLFKKRANSRKRMNVFSQRGVTAWNQEKKEVVQARKTSGFKARFDREEMGRREAREGSDVRLYKLLYRVGEVG